MTESNPEVCSRTPSRRLQNREGGPARRPYGKPPNSRDFPRLGPAVAQTGSPLTKRPPQVPGDRESSPNETLAIDPPVNTPNHDGLCPFGVQLPKSQPADSRSTSTSVCRTDDACGAKQNRVSIVWGALVERIRVRPFLCLRALLANASAGQIHGRFADPW